MDFALEDSLFLLSFCEKFSNYFFLFLNYFFLLSSATYRNLQRNISHYAIAAF
jgi:hypothetical protein